MMADAIGAKLDRMTFDVTFTAATGDSDLGFMQIPDGTVGGVYGLPPRLGRRHATSSASASTGRWASTSRRPSRSSTATSSRSSGCPTCAPCCTACRRRTGPSPASWASGMIYTAMPVTNAVPAVVAAPPGIVTLADLPPVTGRFAG